MTESLWSFLRRRMRHRKSIAADETETELHRYLNVCHLTMMGVGSTIGVGIYVLIGLAAKQYAGPGILVSFFLAGVVTLMNALCFAELGSRIPKTGGVYTYVYESTCQALAFLNGWLMLLGTLCSGSVAARAWSGYVDSLFNGAVHNWTMSSLGEIHLGPPFGASLDLLACAYAITTTVVVGAGIHISANVTSILSAVSVLVLLFVSVMGLVIGHASNIVNADHGGFMPMGFGGVIAGTSACYYAFSGFDVICMSAEEAKNPMKSVPRAIILELLLVTLLYCGASAALVAIVPYWTIDVVAPLPGAFRARGIIWAKYIVTIGPALGISNLNILTIYNISRHVYCMSCDGLMFEVFGKVNSRTKSPLVATVVFGLVIAASALILDMKQLVSFSVISGLLCYSFIAAIVILNRSEGVENGTEVGYSPIQGGGDDDDDDDDLGLFPTRNNYPKPLNPFESRSPSPSSKLLNGESSSRVNADQSSTQGESRLSRMRSCCDTFFYWIGVRVWVLLLAIVCAGLALQFSLGYGNIKALDWKAMTSLTLLTLSFTGLTLLLYFMCQPPAQRGFQTPCVPILPALTILVNFTLLISSSDTRGFLTFGLLILTGCLLYMTILVVQHCQQGRDTPLLNSSLSGEDTDTASTLGPGATHSEGERPIPLASVVPHSESESEDEDEIDELDLDLGVVSNDRRRR